jgi:hypothetical protein
MKPVLTEYGGIIILILCNLDYYLEIALCIIKSIWAKIKS